MSVREINDVNEWSAIDLFELHQHLYRGYGVEGVARFLGRDPETVRLKTEELDRALRMARAREAGS
jgi:hypothetical protein